MDDHWCLACKKPRALYKVQAHSFSAQDKLRIDIGKEQLLYTCGSVFATEQDMGLKELVVARQALTCSSPVETQYFVENHPLCCSHCGERPHAEDQLEVPEEVKDQWKLVLPMCKTCTANGKSFITRIKRVCPLSS